MWQGTGVRRQEPEDRSQEAGDRRQEPGGRSQESESIGHRAVVGRRILLIPARVEISAQRSDRCLFGDSIKKCWSLVNYS